LRKTPKSLLFQCLASVIPRTGDPVVSLYPPLSESSVEIIDIAEGVGNEEAFNVPDDSFNPAFFIWLAGIAGTNRKAIVPGEVHEPHIVCDHRLLFITTDFRLS